VSLGCSLTIEFEGRETQAAESWRIQASLSGAEDQKQTLAILRFKAITKCTGVRGNPSVGALSVKVPVTQILEVNLQAKPVSNLSI
jgi:ribosomal protein L30/L7E